MHTSWVCSHWFIYTKALCTMYRYMYCCPCRLYMNHEKLENYIKVYNSEVDRLKELSRQKFELFMSGSMLRILSRNCLSLTTSVYCTWGQTYLREYTRACSIEGNIIMTRSVIKGLVAFPIVLVWESIT